MPESVHVIIIYMQQNVLIFTLKSDLCVVHRTLFRAWLDVDSTAQRWPGPEDKLRLQRPVDTGRLERFCSRCRWLSLFLASQLTSDRHGAPQSRPGIHSMMESSWDAAVFHTSRSCSRYRRHASTSSTSSFIVFISAISLGRIAYTQRIDAAYCYRCRMSVCLFVCRSVWVLAAFT